MTAQSWRKWAMGLFLIGGSGCEARDTDLLGSIGRKTAHHLHILTGGPRGHLACSWEAVRGAMSHNTLDSRVTMRLRWDVYLGNAEVQVRSPAPGVVRLEGTVPDASHRQRALELARSTVGVEEVIDNVKIGVRAPRE